MSIILYILAYIALSFVVTVVVGHFIHFGRGGEDRLAEREHELPERHPQPRRPQEKTGKGVAPSSHR